MKKTMFSLALMLLAAIPAFAQKQDAKCDNAKCKTEQCEKRSCDAKCDKPCEKRDDCRKGDRKGFGKHDRKGDRGSFGKKCRKGGPECQAEMKARQERLFEGITLTESQQNEIASLNAKMAADRQAAKEEYSKVKADGKREKRNAGDKARNEYLDGMKKILTPEQYTKYLENRCRK